MKKFFFIFIFLFENLSFAYDCPSDLKQSIHWSRAQKILKSVEGSHRIGSCQLEIRVCNLNLSNSEINPVGDSTLAEVYIKDEYGRDQYAPLYLQKESLDKSWMKLESSQNNIFFEFHDKNDDPLNGKKEAIYFDLYRNPDGKTIDKLHLGIYGTLRRVRKFLFFYTSQWSSCENKN